MSVCVYITDHAYSILLPKVCLIWLLGYRIGFFALLDCLFSAYADVGDIFIPQVQQSSCFRKLIFFLVIYSFRLFESGEYSDITFVVQGEAVPLHRCLLTARSEYFRDMLQSRWHSRDKVIINKDMVSHPLCTIPK